MGGVMNPERKRPMDYIKVVPCMVLRAALSAILCMVPFLAFECEIYADPFQQGSLRASVVIGSGEAYENDYTIIGLGAGYYVKDGVELGLDGEAWLGGDPDLYKLSPQAKYILPTQTRLRPYVGAFYTHSFVENEDDFDSIGGRGGVYFVQDGRWFLGVGAVYESYLDCDEKIRDECNDIYPEITFSFSF